MSFKQWWCEMFKGHSYSTNPESEDYYRCKKCGKLIEQEEEFGEENEN